MEVTSHLNTVIVLHTHTLSHAFVWHVCSTLYVVFLKPGLKSVLCLAGVCAETTPCGWVSSKDGRTIWMCALYSQSCQGAFRPGHILSCDMCFGYKPVTGMEQHFPFLFFCCIFYFHVLFTVAIFHTSSVSLSICVFCILARNSWVSLMNETEITLLRTWCFCSILCSSSWVKS